MKGRCTAGELAALCALLLVSCAERAADQPARGAGASDPSASRSALLASVSPREKAPWLLASDPLGRTHPVYGLALHHMANVYDGPSTTARVLGYMRRGARFRASEEVGREGCARGWYEALGGGFVCHGEGTIVASRPPPAKDPPVLPALSDPLPYRYMKTLAADVPQYLRIPSAEEEQAVLSALARAPAGDAGSKAIAGLDPALSALVRTRMQPGFYVSVDREIVDELTGRAFMRTVRGGYVRADKLVDAKLPPGMGVALGERLKLPIAFVYRAGAPRLRLEPTTGELEKSGGELPLHGAHQLTGQVIEKQGRRYYVTEEGLLLRDSAIRIIERASRPRHTGRSERWIRVDLDRQTLTAYEGERAVFATLVSSGIADHATPTGVYRLHAKHVATTMADDLASDGPYSIEDVPWTMYFVGGYALHAAFWHERFGQPRSHGCVNLAPRDARWLFFWSAPELPSGFHGAIAAVGKGTVVTLDTGSVYELEPPR